MYIINYVNYHIIIPLTKHVVYKIRHNSILSNSKNRNNKKNGLLSCNML